MDNELKETFLRLKEKVLSLDYTPVRSKFVEHIDYALSRGAAGENFIDVLLKLETKDSPKMATKHKTQTFAEAVRELAN